MQDLDYGLVKLNLDRIMKEQNISLTKLSYRAEMQTTQLKRYMRNEIQRIDIFALSRLCYVLKCNLTDIIEYIPPSESKK